MTDNIKDFKSQKKANNNKGIKVILDDDAKSVLKLNSPELEQFKKYLQATPHQKYSPRHSRQYWTHHNRERFNNFVAKRTS